MQEELQKRRTRLDKIDGMGSLTMCLSIAFNVFSVFWDKNIGLCLFSVGMFHIAINMILCYFYVEQQEKWLKLRREVTREKDYINMMEQF